MLRDTEATRDGEGAVILLKGSKKLVFQVLRLYIIARGSLSFTFLSLPVLYLYSSHEPKINCLKKSPVIFPFLL